MSSKLASAYASAGTARSSSSTYETLCKFVLQQRFLRVLLYSLGATWALLSLSSWSRLDPLLHFVRVSTILGSAASFTLGILPLLVIQKLDIAPRKQGFSTARNHLKALSLQPKAWRTLLAYQVSAAVIAISYVFLAQPESRISIFKSTRLYPWHLNERFIFLLCSNVFLAFLYGLRTLLLQTWSLRWSTRLDQNVQTIFINRLNLDITPVAKWTGISSSLFVFLYVAFSRWLFRGLLWLYVFRPFIHNFVWSRVRVVSLGLIGRMLLLNIATSLLWLFSETLFSVNASQPLAISQHASKPVDCLVSGLESKSSAGYFKYFAFHELFTIAQDPKAAPRRKAIFSELRGPGSTGAWGSICREILLVVGKDYQTILNRGKPSSAQKPQSPAPLPAPIPSHTIPPRTPSKLQKAQYAPLQRSPTEKIMDGLEYSVHAADAALSHIPKIIDQGKQLSRSISGRLGQSTSGPSAPASSALVGSISSIPSPSSLVHQGSTLGAQALENANAQVPSQLRSFIGGVRSLYVSIGEETADRKIDMIMPNLELDVWAIKALCHFTAASFAEDPYGLVQRDIPKIIESLLLLKQALEDLSVEFQADEFNERLGPLKLAIGSGLHLVISTFHDRLGAFRFPPPIARKLQDLIDVSP